MKELPSAQFRKTFHKLTEPTVVTVNGHPIGMWTTANPEPHRGGVSRLVAPEDVEDAPRNAATFNRMVDAGIDVGIERQNALRDGVFGALLDAATQTPVSVAPTFVKGPVGPRLSPQAQRDAWLRGTTKDRSRK